MSASVTWGQNHSPVIAKAPNKFLASTLAEIGDSFGVSYFFHLGQYSFGQPLLNNIFYGKITEQDLLLNLHDMAACEWEGWRRNSRKYLGLFFLIYIPSLTMVFDCLKLCGDLNYSLSQSRDYNWTNLR